MRCEKYEASSTSTRRQFQNCSKKQVPILQDQLRTSIHTCSGYCKHCVLLSCIRVPNLSKQEPAERAELLDNVRVPGVATRVRVTVAPVHPLVHTGTKITSHVGYQATCSMILAKA